MSVNHPHFDHIDAATELYRSKATGMYVILSQRGASNGGPANEADCVVALPAMPDGSRVAIHAEPIAWAQDEWDVLDKVHAMR